MLFKTLNIFFALVFLVDLSAQVPDSIYQIPSKISADTIPTLPNNPPMENIGLDSINTTSADSLETKPKKQGFLYRVWKEDYPNPKKAMLLSFALPGTGQIYNKRWWKLPIVYGGMGLTGFFIGYNQKRYKIFRDAYIAELNDEAHAFEGFYDAGDLKFLRDGFDQRRQWSWIGFLGFYLFQGAEAFVDAHLKTFDVSDDLSLKIKPTLQQDLFNQPSMGLSLALQFK